MRHENIHPQWVLVEGKHRHVSDFAHFSASQRPPAVCPICKHSVIMKLGKVRVHHYAHYPEDLCVASQPETALHLNTKYYLAEQLRSTQSISYGKPCKSYCGRIDERIWVEGWDRVEVEYTVGNYRLDVALLQEDKVIGAIEVLVTHAMEPEKEVFLASQDIPWIEIEAKPELFEGDQPWTPDQFLPDCRLEPKPLPYECSICKNERARREAKARRREEYRRNNHTIIRFCRIVDFYYPSGKKWRETLIIEKGKTNGRPFARLRTWDNKDLNQKPENILTLKKVSPTMLQELKDAAAAWIQRKQTTTSALVDEFMDWHDWDKKPRPHPRNLDAHPFKYNWTGKEWVVLPQYTLKSTLMGSYQQKHNPTQPIRVSAKSHLQCRRCGVVTNLWPFMSFEQETNTCLCYKCNSHLIST